MNNLTLSDIINLTVSLSPVATVRAGFNVGLIVGTTDVISAVTRTQEFASLSEMIDAGFETDDPEYLAAGLYFGQSKVPSKLVIGRWDNTGTETALQAVTACRASNTDWYSVYLCDAVKEDILAVAGYIETAYPTSVFFYDTGDADVLAGTAGNVIETLKGLHYSRTIGQYSTDDYSIVAIMGYAMGASDTTYTLALKPETGVTTENLTSAQVTSIKGNNGNVYVNRGLTYNVFEQGVMASGQAFDEVIGLDILVNDIKTSVMDALTSNSKIPQTEDGVSYLVSVISSACLKSKNKGFLAGGRQF